MNIAFRMDDIGASSKQFEVYSKIFFGNFLFLKYYFPFKAWGPYDELSCDQWYQIFEAIDHHKAKLTIGMTAAWVDSNSRIIPFPEKFPKQANILKKAFDSELIEIANHGLSHCVIGKHLPKKFISNRKFHREFWDWLPEEIHYDHLKKSQSIFHRWLGREIQTFIPPGNVMSEKTIIAAKKIGIKIINTNNTNISSNEIKIIDEKNVVAFHDREIVIYGIEWLDNILKKYKNDYEYKFIRDL